MLTGPMAQRGDGGASARARGPAGPDHSPAKPGDGDSNPISETTAVARLRHLCDRSWFTEQADPEPCISYVRKRALLKTSKPSATWGCAA